MANEVTELSTDLTVITSEINAYKRIAGEAIFEIGRRLKHVKEQDLAHGEWAKWCDEKIGISRNQATKFITIAEQLDANDSTWNQVGVQALYLIATMPAEERDRTHTTAKGEDKTPDEMTVKELREVKRQLKEEQERVSKLESEKDAERSERERLEQKEPEVRYETKTEYVDNTDYEAEKRLRQYEEKFGDLRNYDEHVTATHRQDMIVACMSFSKGVREFIKRYEYMTKYHNVIDNLDDKSRAQYNEAVNALKDMAAQFGFTSDGKEIINAEYSEID